MAPESERAPAIECRCEHPYRGARAVGTPDFCERCRGLIVPTEPTLTCSEVVERLIQEAFRVPSLEVWFDRAKAEKILHSWRERRVQELEEAIKYMVPKLDQHEELPDWVREITNAL